MSIRERKRGYINMKFVDVTDEVMVNKDEYNYYNVIIYEWKGEWVALTAASSRVVANYYIDDFIRSSHNKWKCEKRYFKYVKEN